MLLSQFRTFLSAVRVSPLTLKRMLRESAFDLLGDLYPDDDGSHLLLARLGAARSRLPARGARTARNYWLAVCEEVDKGAFAFTLDDLVAEARADFPRSDALARLAGESPGTGAGPGRDAPEAGALRVLCLLGSPGEKARLRLDVEQRTIHEVAERWPRITVSSRPATRTQDILPALLTVEPHVVHFAGHGDPYGGLVFDDLRDQPTRVKAAMLAEVFAAAGQLLCVVLNSCYTGEQAEAFLGAATAVTGSTAPLSDTAAIDFSRGFYQGLGANRTVRAAFGLGKAEMGLHRHDTSALRYLDREGSS